jgi:Right handed beta helix region
MIPTRFGHALKLFAIPLALTLFLWTVSSVFAAPVVYIANTAGSSDSNSCSYLQPCATVFRAFNVVDSGGEIDCLGFPIISEGVFGIANGQSYTLDCPGVYLPAGIGFQFLGGTVRIRHLTISGILSAGAAPAIFVNGNTTLILEDCVFENFPAAALDIEPTPNSSANLIVNNSTIRNNGSGVLLKPQTGSIITAVFDRVTIFSNTGGGLKSDSTNGSVTADISNSAIMKNGGNGLNAVGGAGGPNMFNIHNSVIAKNGVAGVQVNGATAATMLDTTLLDSNASGATSVVAGGHILTYGNNRIVGPDGSGFTGPATLR